jgi:DNA-binding XRE family transcriptional regulator
MSRKSPDPALSARLRDRLGVTQMPEAEATLATASEMRALRAVLRLTRGQMATFLGINATTVTRSEREGVTVLRLRNKAARSKLTHALGAARELDALAYDPGEPRPRIERPPSDLEYRCGKCGKDLAANRIRKLAEEWVHGRQPCGPVIPGGPTHRARVVAMREART